MGPEEITPNVPVYHRANPGRLGILTGGRLDTMCVMAEVDWGNQIEYVDVSQLELRRHSGAVSTEDEVQAGRYGNLEDLRRRITFEKLRGMLTDVFYSMKTSEIDFFPHQFKPVLRFIESATNRLLIADEVGLGKTIEAGLIWTEWQAREKARRLLVVCPPSLVPKWLRELQDRFQFAAEATNAEHLLELLERFDRRGPGLSFVLVTSYHSVRPFRFDREELERIQTDPDDADINALPPRVRLLHRIRTQSEEAAAQAIPSRFLDMIVFDEAHSMKNTGSASYYAGETLSAAAGAAVCLTATPVHNDSRDLYALLRLIDPEVFRDEAGFDELRQRNLPIVQLQNALNRSDWSPATIEPLLAELIPESRTLIAEAFRRFDGSARSRSEIRYQAQRLNLLGSFINRTRKLDVITNKVIRMPVTLSVSLSATELNLYHGVLATIRASIRRRGDRVTSFHLIHPALRMSSSLPVIAAELRNGRWGGFEELEMLAEDAPDAFDVDAEAVGLPSSHELRELARFDFVKGDSKYRELLAALRQIHSGKSLRDHDTGRNVAIGPGDKIIIFAFFKATIRYLHERLSADGFQTIAVTGDISDREERDRIMRAFEHDENRILLCSEIGAEGIDLQFARVVINYDLPWNPMRVEQRIGRIDRIGQKSPSIVIINFYIAGTIDGSIYAHLYRKIGIFEHSIGALEGILGDAVAKLTSEIFREELSPEQIEARARQSGDALENQRLSIVDLEQSTGALIAFQDLLSEKVGESQRLGRFIKPNELRLHLEDFLTAHYGGSDVCLILPDNPAPDCLVVQLSQRALSDFESFCQVSELPWPDGFPRTGRITITLDPAVHQQLRREFRALRLITHLHPFFRWITNENEKLNNAWHKVSAIRVESAAVSPGRYFYLIYRLSLDGLTRRDAFHFALRNLVSGTTITGNPAEDLLNQAMERGESLFPRDTGDHTADLVALRAALATELADVQRRFHQDQEQKFSIRRQQLEAHFSRRIEAWRRRIATAEQRESEGRGGLAGFRQTLRNIEGKRSEQLARLRDRAADLKESFAEVACGLVEVVATPSGQPAAPS